MFILPSPAFASPQNVTVAKVAATSFEIAAVENVQGTAVRVPVSGWTRAEGYIDDCHFLTRRERWICRGCM